MEGLVGWPLADTLPTEWSHVNHRSSVDQGKSASKDQRPNCCAMSTTEKTGIPHNTLATNWRLKDIWWRLAKCHWNRCQLQSRYSNRIRLSPVKKLNQWQCQLQRLTLLGGSWNTVSSVADTVQLAASLSAVVTGTQSDSFDRWSLPLDTGNCVRSTAVLAAFSWALRTGSCFAF